MNDATPDDLTALRAAIGEADRALVEALAERLRLVDAIARRKALADDPIRDPGREREVIAEAEARARELGVPLTLVRRIVGDVVSHSVARQGATVSPLAGAGAPVRVAFQGVAHAYSHLAAQQHLASLGREGEFAGHRTFAAVVEALLAGRADLAVLPVENTTAGSIPQVHELLRTADVHIVGEETWKVDHCLAAPEDVPLTAIHRVLSHPQGLEQCAAFLASLPAARPVPFHDTAEAMAEVARDADPSQAAIGSPEAARAHGLRVLAHGIADQAENWTRFLVLARTPVPCDARVPAKTSIVLHTRHEHGALARCLAVLAEHGLQLTKLESRPSPGRPWEYLFFVDFEGNAADPAVAGALDALRAAALVVKVLGSYPARVGSAGTAAADLRADAPGSAAPGIAVDAVAPAAGAKLRHASRAYRLASRDAQAEDTVVRVGDVRIGGDGFVVIAGPCSVESAAQIDATARAVCARGAQVLRGGVFKPRTSPYAFQGLGEEGLRLLAAAGHACGVPVVTEVMAPEQVRAVAAAADLLQIGARNMQNFDLLREVGRAGRPVLLKRGPSSTIEEWLSAAEYVLAQGNGQVILCERGIRTFETATRNTLDLSAVPVLRERTHLPVIVDPSHGTGKRPYVAPMAWAARAAGAHGVIVEVHPEPEQALSDGEQSLTPDEFAALMEGLRRVPGPGAAKRA